MRPELEHLLPCDSDVPGARAAVGISMQDLLQNHSAHLVRAVQECGIRRLGQLTCLDTSIIRRLDASGILTAASATPEAHWPSLWTKQLGVPLELLGVRVEGGAQEGVQACAPRAEQARRSPRKLWSLLQHLVNNRLLHSAVSPDSWNAEVRFDCFLVALRDAAAPGPRGLLHPLLRRYREGAASLATFSLPAVQAVIHHKWVSFAQRLLLVDLCFFALWLAAFTTFMILYTDDDATLPLHQLLHSWRGRASLACDVLVLLGMSPFLLLDIKSTLTQRDSWWPWSFWKVLDLVVYVIQLVISGLHFSRFDIAQQTLPVLIGTQYVLMWLRLQYFSRAFRSTRFDFMDSLQVVMSDVWWYLLVMLLLMWGFAGSFFMLFKGQEPQGSGGTAEQFENLPLSLLTMFNYAVGGTSYYIAGFLHSQHPAAALTLCIVYQVVVSMVLMSLLTGVMANALVKVTASQGQRLLASRAEIINELEALRPLAMMLHPHNARAWHPAYIYVLRLDPSCRETVDTKHLWVNPTDTTDALAAAGVAGVGASGAALPHSSSQAALAPAQVKLSEGLDARVGGLERKLDLLAGQLDMIQQLLMAGRATGQHPAIE